MTPSELITAAQLKLTTATASIADAQTLLDQAKAGLPPIPTLYVLTVVSGSGDGSYEAGAIIVIVADAPPIGQVFLGWSGPVATPSAPMTTVLMPAAALTVTATYGTVPPPIGGRVKSLTHVGSFNVPAIAGPDANGFAYGGSALGFNPARNSLFLAGFPPAARVGELSIPALGGTASLLQTPVDPFGGKLGQINPGDPNQKNVGGTLVDGDSLVVSAYAFYDASGSQVVSHFRRPLNLSSAPSTVIGPYRVGPLGAGFYSGYMARVPADWQSRFLRPALTGNSCLNIISRTSYGPSVASFDPSSVSQSAVETVGYPAAHPTLGKWDASPPGQYYGGSDRVTGVAMPVGFSSVLFVGRHGTTFCYGDVPPCKDPADGNKGVHGYPYRTVCWLYDANDLAAVVAGTKAAYDVLPYDMIDLPSINPNSIVGGCALDPATGRLYVSEQQANGTLPVIHVYTIS